MDKIFSRTEMLIGSKGMDVLSKSKVAIFGVGGVGSYAAEALARSGIGHITLIDKDVIDKTNINRQIHANIHTIGKPKVIAMRERILSINPYAEVDVYHMEYNNQNSQMLIKTDYDYVIDAIDTISAKIDLVIRCKQMKIPIISSMGAGNKLDPTAFKVVDVFDTHTDPIARIMRNALRKHNITDLKVVWSDESPVNKQSTDGRILASIAFVASVVGLIMAGQVIKDLIDWGVNEI